jgi:hypothetical protein
MAQSSQQLFDELVDAAVLDADRARRLLAAHPDVLAARSLFGETALHFLAVEGYSTPFASSQKQEPTSTPPTKMAMSP